MKLLVLGAGMMGSSAAYDMARCGRVEEVTLADADKKLACLDHRIESLDPLLGLLWIQIGELALEATEQREPDPIIGIHGRSILSQGVLQRGIAFAAG